MITFRQPFRGEWPVTQKYGEKITSTFHTGIDYGCPLGTPILASADGLVVFAGMDQTGYGKLVILRHNDGRATLYAHLSEIYVHLDEFVKQSTVIGLSGSTGYSTGPHLHFEARKTWNDYRTHFDPMDLPLMSMDDSIPDSDPLEPGEVKIIAPAGAYFHDQDFAFKKAYPCGTKLRFNGKTTEHNGLIFCECEMTGWVAKDDGETLILANT